MADEARFALSPAFPVLSRLYPPSRGPSQGGVGTWFKNDSKTCETTSAVARAQTRVARRRTRVFVLFSPRLRRELGGIVLLASSLIGAIALATYSSSDPVFVLSPVANRAGVVGVALSTLLLRAVGYGSYVLLAAAAGWGGRLVLGGETPPLRSRFWAGTALLLAAVASLPPLLHDILPEHFPAGGGGIVGAWLASGERTLFSNWGGLVLSSFALVMALLALSGLSLGRVLAAGGGGIFAAGRAAVAAGNTAAHAAQIGLQRVGKGMRRLSALTVVWRERRARKTRVAAIRSESEPPPASEITGGEGIAERGRRRSVGPDIVDHAEQRRTTRAPTQESFAFRSGGASTFRPPDISIFQEPPRGARAYDRDSLIMNSRILEKKLRDFGVVGRVVTVHPGPVITMYEFEPASGVKVNRIVNLADDLALALRALSVRIIAPLPGKSVVGIEVPNAEREVVYLRDLLEAKSFRDSPSKLTIALGKDIFGNPVEADLAKMPHLLVAGATGTGKSVFLNALLCSILFRAGPAELKLLLIDPKVLELSIYEGIPHLIADVVTNPKRAAAALAGVVHKMEERYQMMAALGVRNIQQFNERALELRRKGEETFRFKSKAGEDAPGEFPLDPLAYIVVVIDELADLMVVSARDVEESLQRLAQMARAAGIHLVLATQRPSVDVLTGVIKANFPSRISFQVSSRTDSRTILDHNGAEHLLGQGDMLFLPPGTSKLQRLHGAFVSEREVSELVAFLCEQGAPVFDDTLLRLKQESERKEESGGEVDEMFDAAVDLIARTRNASISHLQRRLKVGYNRAARMIERMEEEGIIGPQIGVKPREVFARSPDVE